VCLELSLWQQGVFTTRIPDDDRGNGGHTGCLTHSQMYMKEEGNDDTIC